MQSRSCPAIRNMRHQSFDRSGWGALLGFPSNLKQARPKRGGPRPPTASRMRDRRRGPRPSACPLCVRACMRAPRKELELRTSTSAVLELAARPRARLQDCRLQSNSYRGLGDKTPRARPPIRWTVQLVRCGRAGVVCPAGGSACSCPPVRSRLCVSVPWFCRRNVSVAFQTLQDKTRGAECVRSQTKEPVPCR